ADRRARAAASAAPRRTEASRLLGLRSARGPCLQLAERRGAARGSAARRLRHAASLLCDLSWHEHPDYRADQALHTVLFMPVAGLDHAERAWLAAAVHARYGGNELGLDVLQGLLDEETIA